MLPLNRVALQSCRASRNFSSVSRVLNAANADTTAFTHAKRWVQPTTSAMHEVFNLASKNSKAVEESPTNVINDRFHRSFNSGATVDPYDFNYAAIKWKSKQGYETKRARGDVMKKLRIDPRDLYVCPSLLSNYMSGTGRIASAEVNNFNYTTQKRLAQSIKRAQCIGLLSKWHKDILNLLPRSSKQLRRF